MLFNGLNKSVLYFVFSEFDFVTGGLELIIKLMIRVYGI